MAQHVLRNERGTTLIQVLGAVIILTMIILSFVGISQYTTASNSNTDKRDKALFIAEEIVNNLRAGVTPTATFEGYSYKIEDLTLASNIQVTAISGTPARNQLTLTSVILVSGTPKLHAVTVSWGG